MDAKDMKLVGVRIELPSQQPIVLLREVEGERFLPIYVGSTEATSIALVLQGQSAPRPLTHDLLRTVLDETGVELEGIVISDLRDGTFYATMQLRARSGPVELDARPSDAIAMAARTGAPIRASELVLDRAGMLMPEGEGDEEEEVERFREFLENVDPEDFEGR